MATKNITAEVLRDTAFFLGARRLHIVDTGCDERIVIGDKTYCVAPATNDLCEYSGTATHECPHRKIY